MRMRMLSLAIILFGLLTASSPALAHHAWRGYDNANMITLKGTVKEYDWENPHVWITLEVKDDKGGVEKWTAGGPSPSRLAAVGWDKDTLKPGDEISLTAVHGNDGSHELRLEKITLADGREMICYGKR